MTTLTAGHIAQYIRQSDEPLGAAIARFRTWEKMCLVKPLGERNPGTGRKKRYSTTALIEATLIQALTEGLGTPAIALRRLIKQANFPGLSQTAAAAILQKNHEIPRRPAYVLLISKLLEREFIIQIATQDSIGDFIKEYVSAPDGYKAPIHVVINLEGLFKPLPEHWADSVKDEVLDWARSQKALESSDTEAEFQDLVEAEKRKLKRQEVIKVRTREAAKSKS